MATLPSTGDFIAAANEYCRVLEAEVYASKTDFVQRVLASLARLYEAGLALPDVSPQSATLVGIVIEHAERVQFQKRVVVKLDGEHPYRMIPEPLNLNTWEEPVVATLADDL